MTKFNKSITVYSPNSPNNTEFTFRKGYSYISDMVNGKLIVYSVDRSVRLELDEEDMKWIEIV